MLNKLAEWRNVVIQSEESKELTVLNYKKKQFRVIVTYDKCLGGYKVQGSVDGVPGVWVSSQRNEIRVFKTLDNLAKLLTDLNIKYFEVFL